MKSTRRQLMVRGLAASAVAAAAGSDARAQMPKKEPLKPELVKEFVMAAHGDLEKVKALFAEQPALLNATWDWGNGDFESAMGGAGHTGGKEIARFLIANGARTDIFVHAMLGDLDIVKATLTKHPGLLESRGPHRIPLIIHAKMGGDEAKPVYDYLISLGAKPPMPK